MSGESYGNVQSAPIETANMDDLRRLRRDLQGTLDHTAFLAFDLGFVISGREDIDRRIERLQAQYDRLHAPLKAFNYWQSADDTEENFREVLERWMERGRR